MLLKAVTEKKDKLSRYPQQRVHTLIHRTCCKPLHQELVPDTQFPEALIPPNRPCRTGLTSLESSWNPKPSMGSAPSSRTSEIFNSKPDRPCYLQTSIYRNCTPETSGTSETLQYLWNLRTAPPLCSTTPKALGVSLLRNPCHINNCTFSPEFSSKPEVLTHLPKCPP